ncbi:MAG: M6 family metalloprotease domain-containing protein [Bacteroidales bacterium]|jgi:M6 family metalloprotease-like protein|nr:M6 family metalloprotease domain-containing protein [Bacteroidales bacterium]
MNKKIFNSLKVMIISIFFTFISQVLYAVPANPTPITVRQSDGRSLTLILQGDERVNWAKTLDNYSLLRNDEGFWTYAVLNDNGDMVYSQYLAVNKEERTKNENSFLATLPFDLRYNKEQIRIMRDRAEFAPNPNEDKYPTQGTVKLPVILVQFQDLAFTYTNANFQSLATDSNYNGTGSVKDYYRDNSGGNFLMDIDVIGPVTIPYNMNHFGGTSNMDDFYIAAVQAADALVDFSLYDNDNDNKIDAVHFIFAGTPQSSTQNPNEIWPHRSAMYSLTGLYDGITFQYQPYSCSAEKRSSSQMDGIGTICHEFGHVLGFPDFYDTDYSQSGGEAVTPGTWDLMAAGSYNNSSATPAGLNAWEKALCNWITPVTLTTTQDSLVLPALTRSNVAYKIPLSSNEFFMLEHRIKEGWDTYIPGSGMLIFHGDNAKINAWLSSGNNSINVDPSNRGWFIEPASGNYNQTESAAAPFPGTSGNTNYTDYSTPASTLKNGTATGKPITEIRYTEDTTIVFNFMSNYPAVQTNTQVAGSVTGTTAIVSGKIIHKGGTDPTQVGFFWSIYSDSVNANANTVIGSMSNDSIIATLTSLPPSTTIYYRAFVTNSYGTRTGNLKNFTTLSGLGLVTTAVATNIGDNSATLGGNLINYGDGTAVDMGIVYTSDPNVTPTLSDNSVSAGNTSLGAFTVSVSGLQECVRYYYRAYVTTNLGTSYGSKLNFRTTYPAVSNNQISGDETLCAESVPTSLTGTVPTGGLGNFTYLWQQKGRTGSNWIAANGTNNSQNYQPDALMDSTFYRRIVFSNVTITDTSNTILKIVNVSRGGRLTKRIGDTISLGQSTDTITLSGYRGNIIDWERQHNEGLWEALGNTSNKYIETPDADGTYAYRVTVRYEQCPVGYSDTLQIVIKSNALTDINDVSASLNLYPNPSNGLLSITSDIKNNANLTITNANGQIIYKLANIDLSKRDLDLRNLESGVYVLIITTENQEFKRQFVIKK